MKRSCLVLLIIVTLASCSENRKTTQEKPLYFDLVSFFEAESARLSHERPMVMKTVSLDGNKEHKKLVIKNWIREFNAFSDADINKASWRGSFKIEQTDSSKIYSSNNEKIAVKRLEVSEKNGKVSAIYIKIRNDNDLYHSNDDLVYIPNRFYGIKKVQNVRLMGRRNFEVTGRFMQQ